MTVQNPVIESQTHGMVLLRGLSRIFIGASLLGAHHLGHNVERGGNVHAKDSEGALNGTGT